MGEWKTIESAPLLQSVLIFIPGLVAEHYGPGIYRGLKKKTVVGNSEMWMVTGWHSGSDLPQERFQPTHWMPLPDPPETQR